MKNTNKVFGFAVISAIVFSAALLLGCPAEERDNNPQPHKSTITAFGKTATVTGAASIPAADFATAVKNLKSTLETMSTDSNIGKDWKIELAKMMERGITIVAGNNAPATVGGALTVGAGYLINSMSAVYGDIIVLAAGGAFAE
jgi:hypothetical protein